MACREFYGNRFFSHVFADGSSNYNPSNNTYTFTVFKKSLPLIINPIESIIYNNTLLITYNLEGDIKVSIFKDNNLITNKTTNNNYVEFNNLNSGTYNVLVEYMGDLNHNTSAATQTFNVLKATPDLSINAISDVVFNTTLTVRYDICVYPLIVSIIKDGKIVESKISYSDTVSFDGLAIGDYIAEVKYLGDENYNEVSKNTTFKVVKAPSSVSINPVGDLTYGDQLLINISYINGSGYYEVKRNEESVDTNNLKPGSYTITAYNLGDENHSESKTTLSFNIFKQLPKININSIESVIYGDSPFVSFTQALLSLSQAVTSFLQPCSCEQYYVLQPGQAS